MTHHTTKRRPYGRRFRQVSVTTTRREGTSEVFARIITNATLSSAQLEADARADHHARLALDRSLTTSGWLPPGEEARDV